RCGRRLRGALRSGFGLRDGGENESCEYDRNRSWALEYHCEPRQERCLSWQGTRMELTSLLTFRREKEQTEYLAERKSKSETRNARRAVSMFPEELRQRTRHPAGFGMTNFPLRHGERNQNTDSQWRDRGRARHQRRKRMYAPRHKQNNKAPILLGRRRFRQREGNLFRKNQSDAYFA